MHACININKCNRNQKKKRNGGKRACSAAPTMNEKDETCNLQYINVFPANCALAIIMGYPGLSGTRFQPNSSLIYTGITRGATREFHGVSQTRTGFK